MSISFAAQPAAVKIRRPNSTDEFVTGGDGHDWVFDLYGVERDKALILNEHELVWVELNRVHVLLNDDIPSEAEGPHPGVGGEGELAVGSSGSPPTD